MADQVAKREDVDNMSIREVEALMLKAGLLAHMYRWDRMPTPAENYRIDHIQLPTALDSWWSWAAERLQVPRVGSFYSMICSNFQRRVDGPGDQHDDTYLAAELTPDNVTTLHTWLDASLHNELNTFVMTALVMEAHGARLLQQILPLLDAWEAEDHAAMLRPLEELRGILQSLAGVFNRNIKASKMKPENFLTRIQPTMVWLIDGLEGANGPQCCTIQ